MRAYELKRIMGAWLRTPLAWISVGVFGGLIGCMVLWSNRSAGLQGPRIWVGSLVCPMLGALGYRFLAGLPWNWTGDERPMAKPLRGILQSSALSLLFYLSLHYLDRFVWHLLLGQGQAIRWPRPTFYPWLWQTPFMVLIGLLIAMGERDGSEKRQAEARLKEAQWILLRAQLSPHILFNTLNALAELAIIDPPATERSLLELSDFYERMLRHGDRLLAPLSEERVILERYLTVQALRLGSRLQVVWEWESGLDGVEAPPLLLQPLVENALKHGIAVQRGPGRLRIHGGMEGGRIRLEVWNTGPVPEPGRSGATGLENLRERIRLAYGERARFVLERRGDWTVASLGLPEVSWVR